MTETDYPNLGNLGIAELIGTPADMSKEFIQKHEPFTSKSFSFANLSEIEISCIFDDLTIKNIEKRSNMTRYQKQRFYSGEDLTDIRAYLTATLSLAKDGLLTKRITSSHKTLQMQGEGDMQKGGMLHFLKRGGGSNGGGSSDG